ncbi:MAG: insulinase family protein [Gemmatimonadota bacterium]
MEAIRAHRPFAASAVLAAGLALAGCAATGSGAGSAAPSAPPVAQVLPVDPDVLVGQLDNGLRYVLRRNTRPEKRAELRLAVDAGSILERPDQQGLAHFVEHMAFNGTTHFARQELIDYLELIGMEFGPEVNAYTSFDETVYMLTVPTDTAGVMETAFQIYQDWAQGISFDDGEVDKERGVITEEWRLRRGADQRMFDAQAPVLYRGSRYADRLPIGQMAVVDTFHHEVLRDFYRTWYRPELMGFAAVGDFDLAQMEALVRQYLGAVPAAGDRRERPLYPVPDHEETLFAIATDPEATANRVQILYKRPIRDYSTVDSYRRSLIEGLYHRMLNQRLYELTQAPSPPFLYAGSGQGRWVRTKEVFVLAAGVQDNGFDAGLEALLTEASRVQQHGFTAGELAREKKEMLRGMEQAYRERDKLYSASFAGEYLRHLLEGEPIPGIEAEHRMYQEMIPGIELDEVNALASEWTRPYSRVVMVNAPYKPGLTVPGETDLTAIFDRVAAAEIGPYEESVSDRPIVAQLPPPGQIAQVSQIPEIGVTLWTLGNGVRVYLKPTDFQNDEIRFSAYSPGGSSLVGDGDYVAASTAASVVEQGGLGDFTLIDLQKKLAGKVVSASPWISTLQEGMSGAASPQDVETLFELIHAYFTAPRADPDAFQSLQTRYRGFIENRSARPETAFGDTVQVTMAQHHLRARPWSLEMVDEMSLETSMRVYRERFADASDFTFAFVGNFTVESMEPLVCAYLGSLPALRRGETWHDVGMVPPAGVVQKVVRRGIEPKSRTQLIFTGPFAWDGWRRSFELAALGQVMEIKLREVLREDLGGTYGVGVSASGSRYPTEEYRISISFGCNPERVEELTGVVLEQIDSLKAVGTTDVYVTKVKEINKRHREVQLRENDFWVSSLTSTDFNGLDPRLLVRFPEMVDSLTTGAVQAAAQQYLNTGNYVQVTLLPEEGGSAAPAGD